MCMLTFANDAFPTMTVTVARADAALNVRVCIIMLTLKSMIKVIMLRRLGLYRN